VLSKTIRRKGDFIEQKKEVFYDGKLARLGIEDDVDVGMARMGDYGGNFVTTIRNFDEFHHEEFWWSFIDEVETKIR
jgi:hypothetical protein